MFGDWWKVIVVTGSAARICSFVVQAWLSCDGDEQFDRILAVLRGNLAAQELLGPQPTVNALHAGCGGRLHAEAPQSSRACAAGSRCQRRWAANWAGHQGWAEPFTHESPLTDTQDSFVQDSTLSLCFSPTLAGCCQG